MKKLIAILLICCSCSSTQQVLTTNQRAQREGNKWVTRNAANTKQFHWWSFGIIVLVGIGVEKHETLKR